MQNVLGCILPTGFESPLTRSSTTRRAAPATRSRTGWLTLHCCMPPRRANLVNHARRSQSLCSELTECVPPCTLNNVEQAQAPRQPAEDSKSGHRSQFYFLTTHDLNDLGKNRQKRLLVSSSATVAACSCPASLWQIPKPWCDDSVRFGGRFGCPAWCHVPCDCAASGHDGGGGEAGEDVQARRSRGLRGCGHHRSAPSSPGHAKHAQSMQAPKRVEHLRCPLLLTAEGHPGSYMGCACACACFFAT